MKLNAVMWKCPNRVDVAVDLERSCNTVLRKVCCV